MVLHIAGNAADHDVVALEQFLQKQMGLAGVPDPESIGVFPDGVKCHQSRPPALTQLLIAHHLLRFRELGCGTGYFGARLKRQGARRVVGVDITPAQLETARQCEAEFGLGLEFIEANAEQMPLESAQFDLAVSEYGASIWCDPELWIAQAARLLRPGGELVFLRNSTLSMLCTPDIGKVQTSLQRSQRDMYRLEWTDDDPGVEFHPGTGEMVRLLRKNGFMLLDMVELFAPAGAQDHPRYNYVSATWAEKWLAEEIWRARKVDDIDGIGRG